MFSMVTGCFVHEDADRERQAAERHQIDRLAADPKSQEGGADCERNVEHDDQSAAPIPQEQQDHYAGQRRPQQTLLAQAANGSRDIRRLIERVTYLYAGREH